MFSGGKWKPLDLKDICLKDLIIFLGKKNLRTESVDILASLVDCRVFRIDVIFHFILYKFKAYVVVGFAFIIFIFHEISLDY